MLKGPLEDHMNDSISKQQAKVDELLDKLTRKLNYELDRVTKLVNSTSDEQGRFSIALKEEIDINYEAHKKRYEETINIIKSINVTLENSKVGHEKNEQKIHL